MARNSRRRRRDTRRFSALFRVLVFLSVLMAVTLGATVFFQLETIEVTGVRRYTEEEVREASGLELGENLFRINKGRVSSGILQSLPYVEELSIHRKLPSTLQIQVKEWDAAASILPSPAPEGEEGASRATEAWLISVGGKLLEPAPANAPVMVVRGLTLLSPRAGQHLSLPLEQRGQEENLLSLLAALEERKLLGMVSELDFTSATQIVMLYDQRFQVKLPMGADFVYKLRVLETVAAQRESYERGSFDLTRDDYAVIYSPE